MTHYFCGIDIGGTFTDCVLVDDAGKMVTCKVPSTPGDFARGMIAALEAAAARTEQSLGQLCASISVLSHGTTTGTNTVIQKRGAKVGLITTMGHNDVIHIMRGSRGLTGRDIRLVVHFPESRKPDPIVPKRLIHGISERFAESPDANLPAALTQAAEYSMEHLHAKGIFIVPADVPLIQAMEIDQLLAEHTGVTLLPDTEKIGTNGLICSPPNAIPLVFDGKSFKPHTDGALEAGITPRIVPSSGFSLDIDTPGDLAVLLRNNPGCQTGIYLEKSGIAERLPDVDNGPLNSRG